MEYREFVRMWILGLMLAFVAKTTSQVGPVVNVAIRDDSREVYCPMHCFCDMEYAHCGNGEFSTFPVNLDMKVKHIMLQNNKIRSLRNKELRYYKTAESITLHGNQIERIERGAFIGLTYLKKLNLARNRLRRIDKTTFEGLDNLEILNLEDNEIDDLSSALQPLTKLRVLRAGSNKITALREGSFKHSTGLHRLNVSYNEISRMDRDVLKPMPYLRYLILNNNPLGDSASNLNLENNRWIYFVDLTNTQMKLMVKNLPPTASDVRLQNNLIERLYRDDFTNATSLDMLILNDNMLRDIEPGALDHLEHLRELWLTRNRLQRFPRLPYNVRAVHLDHNDIRQIQSRDLETSPNVEFLYLQKNNIQRIASQSFKDMGYLRLLNLRGNQLNELESYTFVNLTNLDYMDLSINPIRQVDQSSFSQLDNLRRLTMSRVEQPTVVRDLNMLQQMKHLQILDMSQSPGLANSFAQSDVILPEVRDLNLMYSDLVTLPQDFPRRVPNINIIKLAGNKYHCNQSLTWMPAWLRRKPSMFFARHLITCATPLALKGRPIFSVPMSEFRKVVGPPDYEEWRRLPTCKDCPCDENGVPIRVPTRRPLPTRGPDFPTGDVLIGGDQGTHKKPTEGSLIGPDGRVIIDSNVKDHNTKPDSGSRVEKEKTGTTEKPLTTMPPLTTTATKEDEVDLEKWPDKKDKDDNAAGEDFTDTHREGGDNLGLDYEEPTTTPRTTTTRIAVLPEIPIITEAPTTTTTTEPTTTTTEPTTTTTEPTTTTTEPITTTTEPTTTTTEPTTTTIESTTTTTESTTTTTEPTTTTTEPTTTTTEPITSTTEPITTTTVPTTTTTEPSTTTQEPTTTTISMTTTTTTPITTTETTTITEPTTIPMPTTTTPEPTTTTPEPTTTEPDTTTTFLTTTTMMTTTTEPNSHISILLGGSKVDREVLETLLIKMGRSLSAFRTGLWRVYVFGTKGNCSSLPRDRVNATERRIIEVMSNEASTNTDVMRRVLEKVFKVRKQVDDEHTGIEIMEHMLQEMAKKINMNREELIQFLLNIFTRTMQCGTTTDPAQSPEALIDDASRRLGISRDVVQGIVWRLFTTGLDYMMKEPEENRMAYMMQIYPSVKYIVRALAFRSGVASNTFRIRLFSFTQPRKFTNDPYCLLKDFAKELDIPYKQMSQVLREIFYTGMDPTTIVGTSLYLHGSPMMHYTIHGMAQELAIPLRTLRHRLWQIFHTTACNTDDRKYQDSVKLLDEISQKLNINNTDILNLLRATFLTGVHNVYMEPTNMTLISRYLKPLYFFTVQGMADNMDMKIRHMREIFWNSLIADSDTTTEDLAEQFDIPIDMFLDVLKWMFRPEVRPSMKGKKLPTIKRMAAELYIPEKTYIGYVTELFEGVHYESDIGRVRTKVTELAKELYIPEINLHQILRMLYKLADTETIARAASFHFVTMPHLTLTYSEMKGVLRTMIYILYRDFSQIQDYIKNGQTTTTTTVEPPPEEPTIGPKWNLTLLQELAAELEIPEVIFKKTLKEILRKMISNPDRDAHQSFLTSIASSLYIPTVILTTTLRKLYTNTPRMTNQYMTGYIEQNLPNIGMSGFNTSIALLRLQKALQIRDQPSFGIDIMTLIRRPQHIKRSILEPALTKLLHKIDTSNSKDETIQMMRNVSQQFKIPFTTFKSILRELLSFYDFPSIENTTDYIYANFINLTIGSLETKDALSRIAEALLDLEKKQEIIKVEETRPHKPESDTGKVLEGNPAPETSVKQVGFFIEDREYKYPRKELDLLFGDKKIPLSKQQRTLNVVLQTAYENGRKNVTGVTKVFVNGNEVKLDEAKLKRLLNVLGISIDGSGGDQMTPSLLRQLIIAAYSLKVPEEDKDGTGTSVFGRGDSDFKPDAYVRINKQDYLLPEDFIERIYDSFTLPENAIRNLNLKFKTTGGSLYTGTGQTTVYVNDKYVPINPEELKQIRDVFGFTTKPMFLRLSDDLVMKLYELAIGPDSQTDNSSTEKNATITINARRYPLNPEQIYNIFGTRYIPESTKDLNLRFHSSGTMVYVNGRVAVLSDRDTKLLQQLFGDDTVFDPMVASQQLPTRLLKKLFEAAVRTHPVVTAQPSIAGNIIFYINGNKYELQQDDVTGLFGARGIPDANQRVIELNFLPLSKEPGNNDIKVLINGNEMPLPQDRLQEIKRVVMSDSVDQMTPTLLKLLFRYAFGLDEAGSEDANQYITILGQRYLLPQEVIQRIFGLAMIPITAPRTLELKFKTRGGSLQDGTGTTTVTVNGKWVNLTADELREISDVYAYSKNPQNIKYAKLSDALVVKLYEAAMSPEQNGNFITINRERYQLTPNEVKEIFDMDFVPPSARKGLTLRFVGDDAAPTGNVMVFVNDQPASLSDVDLMILKALYNWGPSADPESPTEIPPTYIIKKLFQTLSTAVPLTTQEPQIVFLVNEKPFELMQIEAARLFGKRTIPTRHERVLEVGFRDEAGTPVVYINGNKGWLVPAERTIVRQALGLEQDGSSNPDMPKPILKKLIRIAFSLPEEEEKADKAEVDEPTEEPEDSGTASRYIFINNRRYRIPAGTIQRIFGESMIPLDVNRTLELKFKTMGGSFDDGTGQTTVTVNDNSIQLSRYELGQIRDSYFFTTNLLPPELVVRLFAAAFGEEETVTEKPKPRKPYIVINGIVYELTPDEVQTLFGTEDLPPLTYRSLSLTFKNGDFGPSKVIVNGTETNLSGADVMILNALFGQGVAQPSTEKPPTYLLDVLFRSLAQISVAPPTTQVVPQKEVLFWVNDKEYWLPESVTLEIFGNRSIPSENQRYLEATFRDDGDDRNAVYVNGNRGAISQMYSNKLRAILGLDHEGTPSPIMTRPLLVNLVQIAFDLQVAGKATGDGSRPDSGSTTFTREDRGGDTDNYITVRGKRYQIPTDTVRRIFGSPTIPQSVSRTLQLKFKTVGGAFTDGTGTTTFTVNSRPVQLNADELQQLRDVYGYSSTPQYSQLATELVVKLFEAGLIDDALGPDEPEAPTESDRGSRTIMIRGQEYLIPLSVIQRVFGSSFIPATGHRSLELKFKTFGGSLAAGTGQTTVKVNDKPINLNNYELNQIRDVFGYSQTPQHTRLSSELAVKLFEAANSQTDSTAASEQEFSGLIINGQRFLLTPHESKELFGMDTLPPLKFRTLRLLFEKPDSGFGISKVFVNGSATDITGADVLILEALYGRETTQSTGNALAQEKPPMYLLKMLFESIKALQPILTAATTKAPEEQVIFWVADKEYGLPKSVVLRMFGSRGIPSTGQRYLEAFFRDGKVTVNGNEGDLEPGIRNRMRAILGLDHHQIDGSEKTVMTDELLRRLVIIAFSLPDTAGTGDVSTTAAGGSTGGISTAVLNNEIEIHGQRYVLSSDAVNRFYGQTTLPASAPRNLTMEFTTIGGSFEEGTGRSFATVNRLNIHLTKSEIGEIRDVWGYTTNPRYTKLTPQLVEKIYEVVVDKNWRTHTGGAIEKRPDFYDGSLGGEEETGVGGQTFTREGSITGEDSLTGEDSITGKDSITGGTDRGGQETGGTFDGSEGTGGTGRGGISQGGNQDRAGHYITIHGQEYRLPDSTIQKLFGSSTLPKTARTAIELRFKTTGGSFYDGTGQTTVTVNTKPITLTANELLQIRDVYGFSKIPQHDRLSTELVSKIFETAILDVISGVEATVTNGNITKERQDRFISIHGKRYLLPVDTVQRIYGQSTLPETAIQNLALDFKTVGGSFYEGTGTTTISVNGKPVALNPHELDRIRRTDGFTATPEFERLSPEIVVKLYDTALSGVNVRLQEGKADRESPVAAIFMINGSPYNITQADYYAIFGSQGLPAGSQKALAFLVKYTDSPRDDLITKTIYVNGKKVDFTETELEDFLSTYKQDGEVIGSRMPIHLVRKIIATAYDRQLAPQTNTMQRLFLINGRSYELTLQDITSIFGAQGIPRGTDQSIRLTFLGANQVTINGHQANLSDEEYQELKDSSLRNYDLAQSLVHKIIRIAYGFSQGDSGVYSFQINSQSYDISRQQLRTLYGSDSVPSQRVLQITWKPEQDSANAAIFINGERTDIPSHYMQALIDSSKRAMPTDLFYLILKKAYALWMSKSTRGSTVLVPQSTIFTVNGRQYTLTPVELQGLFLNGQIPIGHRVISVLTSSEARKTDSGWVTKYKGEIDGTVIDLQKPDVDKLRGKSKISRPLLMRILRAVYKLTGATGTGSSSTGVIAGSTSAGSTVFTSETRDTDWPIFYVNGRSYNLTDDEVENIFGIAGLPAADRRRLLVSYKTSSSWSDGSFSVKTSVFINGKKVAFTEEDIDFLRNSTDDLPRPLLITLLKGTFAEGDDSESTSTGTESSSTETGSSSKETGSSSTETGSTNTGTGSSSTGTGSSSTGTGSPSTANGSSSTGTGSSNTGTGSTSTVNGSSSTGTGSSNTGTGSSSTGTGSTSTVNGSSSTGTGSSNTGTGSSSTGTGSTSTGTGSSNTGTGLSSTGTGSSNTVNGSSSTGTGSSNTGTGPSGKETGSSSKETGSSSTGTGSSNTGTGSFSTGTGSTSKVNGSSSTGTGSSSSWSGSTGTSSGSSNASTETSSGSSSTVFTSETRGTTARTFILNGRPYVLEPEEVETIFGIAGPPAAGKRTLLITFKTTTAQTGDTFKTETTAYVNGRKLTLTETQMLSLRSSGRVNIPRSLLHILLSTAFGESNDTAAGQRSSGETSTTKPKSQPSFYINGRSYKLSPLEVSLVFGNMSLPVSSERMILISFRTSSKQTDDGGIRTITNVYANEKKASLTDEKIQQVRVSRAQELPRNTLYILLKTAFVLQEESEIEPAIPTILPSETTTTKTEIIYINGRRYGLQADEIKAIFGYAGLPAYRRRTLRLSFKKSSSQTDGVFNNRTIVSVNGIKANLTDSQIEQLEESTSSGQDIPRYLLHILLQTAFVKIGGTGGVVFQINGRQYELTLDEIDAVFGVSSVPPSGQALRLGFKTVTTQTDSGPRTETILEINGKKANLTDDQIQQVRQSKTKDLSRDLLYTLLRTAFGLTRNGQKTIASGSTVYTSGTRGKENRSFNVNERQYELTPDEVESIFGVEGLPAPEQRAMLFRFRTSTVKTETGLYRSQVSVYVNGKKLNLTDQQVQHMRASSTRDIPRTLLHLILRTAFVQTAPEVESGSTHSSESSGTNDSPIAFNINGKSYELNPTEVEQVFGEAGAPMDRSLRLTFKTSSMQTGTGFSSVTSIYVNGRKANLTPEQVQEIKNTGTHLISRTTVYTLLRTAYGDDTSAEVPEDKTTVSTTLTRPSEMTRFNIGGRSYDLTAQEVRSIFGDADIPPENDRIIRVSFRTSTSKVGDSYITATSAYANGKELTLTTEEFKQLRKAGDHDISQRLLRIIIKTAFDLHMTDTETPKVSTTESSVIAGTTRFYLGGRGYDLTSQEISSIFGESGPPKVKGDRTVDLTFRMSSSQTHAGSTHKTSVFVNGKEADLTDDEVQEMKDARGQDISRSLLLRIFRTAYATTPKLVATVKPDRSSTFYVNNRPYDLTEKELQALFGDADIPPHKQRQVVISLKSQSRISWTGWKTTTTVSVNGKQIDLSDEEVTAMKASAVTDLSRDLLMKILRSAYATGTSGFEQLAATPIVYNINGQVYQLSLADYRRIFGRAKRRPDSTQNVIMTFRTGVEIVGDGWGVVNNVFLNDNKGAFTEQQVQELKESANSNKKIADDLVLLIVKSAFGEVQVGEKKEDGLVNQGQTYFNINGKQVGFSSEEMQRIFGATGPPPVRQRTVQMSFRSRAVQNGEEWTTETTVKINGKEANLTPDETNSLRTANTQDSYESISRDLLFKILTFAFNVAVTAKQTTPAMVILGKTKGTEAAIQIESKEITVSHDELSKVLGAAFSLASRSSMEIKFGDGKDSGEGEVPDVSVFVNGQKIYLTPEETREIAEYYAWNTSRDAAKMYKERLPDSKPTTGRTLSPQLIQKIIDATSDGRSAEDGGKGEAIEEGAKVDGTDSMQKKPSSLLEHIRRGGAENGQTKPSTSKPKNMQRSYPLDYAVSDYPEDQPKKSGGDQQDKIDDQLKKDEEIWKMMYRMFKF